ISTHCSFSWNWILTGLCLAISNRRYILRRIRVWKLHSAECNAADSEWLLCWVVVAVKPDSSVYKTFSTLFSERSGCKMNSDALISILLRVLAVVVLVFLNGF